MSCYRRARIVLRSKTRMLELHGVSKSFGGVAALTDVSFAIERGEAHALAGENGAGKSTLINILTGVYTEYAGSITLDGQPVRLRGPRDARDRFGIACIHQELSLIPELSVSENVFLAREPRTRWGIVDFPRMESETRAVLGRLGIDLDPRRPVRDLRVGEQQLVEIARALSVDARLLLLDEPSSALSEAEIARLIDVLQGLRESGVTLVYISHKFDELRALADRVTILRDGRCIGTRRMAETETSELIRMMAGRPVGELFPKAQAAIGDETLRIEGLSLLPGSDNGRALQDISLTLHAGEIVGVAGLMGAGRTELLETLAGSFSPRRVRIRRLALAGKNLTRPFRSPREALRAGIALVTEDRKGKSLVLPMSVGRNMTLSALSALHKFRQVGLVDQSAEREAVQGRIAALRVKTRGPEQPVGRLSGGNQQKVVLAKCLLTQPRILLLDEPTRGIDVAAKAEIYRLIGELAQNGMSVLLASSEMPELLALCDRILVLAEGRITTILSREEATQERILEAATANFKDGV